MYVVNTSAMGINMFWPTYEIDTTISPRGLVLVLQEIYKKHFRTEFVSYVQSCEEHDNVMISLNIGATAIHATGNAQEGCYFLILDTRIKIHCRFYNKLPMHNKFIDCVHALDRRSMAEIGITFG